MQFSSRSLSLFSALLISIALPLRGSAQTAASAPDSAIDASIADNAAKKPFAVFSSSLLAVRDSLVATARAQIGTRYKLGADKPGVAVDCSALVKHVLSVFDIQMPRTARQQAAMGEEVPREMDKLEPGDLLTFGKGKTITHIGIYVGEGRMVHASTTGKRVLETAITTRNPLIKQWKGVRRVVGTTVGTAADSVLLASTSGHQQ